MKRIWIATLLLALTSSPAWAQAVGEALAEEVDAVRATDGETPEKGWQYGLSLGTSLSYTHNSHVVGAQEGSTFQFGLVIEGLVGYYGRRHEWVNTLKIQETVSKTPTIDLFLKTADSLDFATTYSYHPEAIPWLGPFARLRLRSAIFPGYDVRAEDTVVQKSDEGTIGAPGATYSVVEAQEKIGLTDWFEPITLRQVVGGFATPVERDEIKLQFMLGIGAQEVFTQGGHVLGDTVDAIDVSASIPGQVDPVSVQTLTALEDYQQVGGDFELDVSGKLNTYVTWGFTVGLFQPFYSSLKRGKEGFDLLEVLIDAKVSVKLASWLSLDYVLSVKRLPLITDEWQVQNGLLLTAGFNII